MGSNAQNISPFQGEELPEVDRSQGVALGYFISRFQRDDGCAIPHRLETAGEMLGWGRGVGLLPHPRGINMPGHYASGFSH
jgi:hypothetical protein